MTVITMVVVMMMMIVLVVILRNTTRKFSLFWKMFPFPRAVVLIFSCDMGNLGEIWVLSGHINFNTQTEE
jgi:uncharacterized integral membrane protein